MSRKIKIVFFSLLFIVVSFSVAQLKAKTANTLVDFFQRPLPDKEFSGGVPFNQDLLLRPGGLGFNEPVGIDNSPNLFLPNVVYAAGNWDEAVGIGDFNHDGLNDVAISEGFNSSGLRIFLQNSNGTLINPASYATGAGASTLAVGDLNKDGLDDVVIGHSSDNTIGVYLQNGSGTLDSLIPYQTGDMPDAIAVADLNNDNLEDVVIAHWGDPFIRVYYQQINGTLGGMVDFPSSQAGFDDIDTGDLNNDGLIDVVKMNGQGYANPNISVYLQNINGSLDGPFSYDLPESVNANGVGTGDVTGDGLVDVVISHGGNRPNSKISVFAQTTTGTLLLHTTYSAYDIPEPVEVADVNMDGFADVLVAHGGWMRMGAFLQQSNGYLAPYELYNLPYASHYGPQGMDVGDINDDGLPDVVVADYNYGLVVLYHTSGLNPTNTPEPFTPTPTSITPSPGPPNGTPIFLPILNKELTPTPTATLTSTPSGWTTLLNETFEETFPSNGWAFYNSSNGLYNWSKRSCQSYQGDWSGWAIGGGTIGQNLDCNSNYPNNLVTWMSYGPFDLQGMIAADLNFKIWFNTQQGVDAICFMASNSEEPILENYDGWCGTGNSGGWLDANLNLADIYNDGGSVNLLGNQTVWIAFAFLSDSETNIPQGAFVDNIVLRRCISNCNSNLNFLIQKDSNYLFMPLTNSQFIRK